MTKKQIDFQVQVAINRFIEASKEMGFEISEEMLAEYRQVLEGFAIREAAQIEKKREESIVHHYTC